MSWPTTNDPREVFVTVRLTQSEADDLDAYASAKGMNRSTAVRESTGSAVTAHKARLRRKQALSQKNDAGA